MSKKLNEIIIDINGTVNITEEYLQEKRQAIIEWAKSCVPEKRRRKHDAGLGCETKHDRGWNEAISQTLKNMEGE